MRQVVITFITGSIPFSDRGDVSKKKSNMVYWLIQKFSVVCTLGTGTRAVEAVSASGAN